MAATNPDAKLNDFFAKKKKKKAPAASASTAPKSPALNPAPAPAAAPSTGAKLLSPSTKGPVIQTKGKAIGDLKTAVADDQDDEDEGDGEGSGPTSFQWAKKPRKKPVAAEPDKKLAIHSERAFPTLGNASGSAPHVVGAGKTVKPPSDVRSQNVYANIDDSDDEDK
ncbi:unnamed protein product [Aphanomyces euteiches]|uniref:Uncharacterized protein n=1 Tax=Aphanomyces euteiches TaxID=100861 RepID=A0A6G0WUV0_9STRA|nr:hypothetical protein Ae201684_011502 [Aphanomyces euteiches]KAH9082797.1 hypothetical protein LEN26_021131 [Aphanomyces euteiches]KAH9097083.1 hypothetical protein Ae201684P_011812 [Aphanomyces euteiches]KAH9114291.1 hypothetical protein AeMF1_011597 [Aphanomyces euteiches]KAH9194657.1 hypothetical protein AeNC1_003372 [Aphanomyces euteiches]